MLNIKDHISEFIYISNVQCSDYFLDQTNFPYYINYNKGYNVGFWYSFLIGLVLGKIWLYINNSSIGKLIINNINIYIFKYISRRILNIPLFWKLFIFLFCLFLIIDIYHNFYYKGVISWDWKNFNVIFNMVENQTNAVVDVDASNSVINVQTPVANVIVPVETFQVASTAVSTALGMKAGLELAKNVPGIGAKAAVVVGTAVAAQAINITSNKIITSSSETKNSFLSVDMSNFVDDIFMNSKNNDKFSEYPYNLIPDLNMYINLEIWFIFILINVLLTAFLLEKKIDINKYIKNDKWKNLLNYIYNRYISVWSVSRNIIIIWCILMLILCIFMSKLILFIVLSV
jgi:hypothetical protein